MDPELSGGEIRRLPNGDLVVFLYELIADSGISVMRLNPESGKTLWSARCAPLGVSHSRYIHQVELAVTKDLVKVTSRGSAGTFIEVLDLGSGRQLGRTRPK
jgi:hypothetical protein